MQFAEFKSWEALVNLVVKEKLSRQDFVGEPLGSEIRAEKKRINEIVRRKMDLATDRIIAERRK